MYYLCGEKKKIPKETKINLAKTNFTVRKNSNPASQNGTKFCHERQTVLLCKTCFCTFFSE